MRYPTFINIILFLLFMGTLGAWLEFYGFPMATQGMYSLYYCSTHNCDNMRIVLNTLVYTGAVALVMLFFLRYRHICAPSTLKTMALLVGPFPIAQWMSTRLKMVRDPRVNAIVLLSLLQTITLSMQTFIYNASERMTVGACADTL